VLHSLQQASRIAVLAAQPVEAVLTRAQLEGMKAEPGFGGKLGCRWQRELRRACLASLGGNGKWAVDLTHSREMRWQALLRAQPEEMRARLVGPGVRQFTFRILQNVRDANYMNMASDSGERHVFELTRVDGSSYHLHFHKGGRLDAPKLFWPEELQPTAAAGAGAAQQPAANADGAAQPVVPVTQQALRMLAAGDTIGRKEGGMALTQILAQAHGPQSAGAVDITDGIAFPWWRWVAKIIEGQEMVGDDAVRAFAVRWSDGQAPQIVICRADDSYASLCPAHQHYHAHLASTPYVGRDWHEHQLLVEAPTAQVSWMQLRLEEAP
jgi:hypothetical protein